MTAILSTAQSLGQFITVFLIFIFVLAVTFFTTKFVGSYQKEKLTGTNIKVIETQSIAQNKFIQIVKIGERYYALAVCKDSVTTIAEIPEESLSFPDNDGSKFSFKEFLAKAKDDSALENTENEIKEIDKD